jgi:hypothetical protein
MALCERCGKRTYPTLRQAYRSALVCLRLRGGGLRVYHCPNGAGWHLTSKVDG